MKEFYPEISKRKTEELILIANSTTEEWQEEAIHQAVEELKKRNVSKKEQDDFFEKKIKEMDKHFISLKAKRKTNTFEKYSVFEMMFIVLFTPFLIGRWTTLYNLKRENYKTKFKQRIILLLIGIVFWFSWVYFSFKDWSENQY